MAKDTFYFSHDYSARNDPKLIKVLMKLGQSGKGVYWDLIEMLYEQEGNLLIDEIESYAFSIRADDGIILRLISEFDLFEKDENYFWSPSVLRRLEERATRSKVGKDNAEKRWGKPSPKNNGIDHIFYVLELAKGDEKFIKCGITSESVSRRFSGKTANYTYEVLFSESFPFAKAIELEKIAREKFIKYSPLEQFGGYLECYSISEKSKILEIAMQCECKPNAIKESKGEESKGEESINTGVETPSFDYDKFILGFNSLKNRSFRVTDKVKKALNARLKNYSKEEIWKAIKIAHNDSYHIETKFKYLTPEFILREEKLEKFLNQDNTGTNGQQKNKPAIGSGNNSNGRNPEGLKL